MASAPVSLRQWRKEDLRLPGRKSDVALGALNMEKIVGGPRDGNLCEWGT